MEYLYVESTVVGYGLDHYLWRSAICKYGSQVLWFGTLFSDIVFHFSGKVHVYLCMETHAGYE